MKKRGFTLIELLIVIAIIGILATIIVINYSGAQRTAKYSKAKSDILSIQSAVKLMAADTKEYPFHYTLSCNSNVREYPYADGDFEIPVTSDTTLIHTNSEGTNSISDIPEAMGLLATDGNYANWNGPYIDQLPEEDPWGNAYLFDPDYVCNGYAFQEGDNREWRTREDDAEFEYGCQGLVPRESGGPNQIYGIYSTGENSAYDSFDIDDKSYSSGYGGDNIVQLICNHI